MKGNRIVFLILVILAMVSGGCILSKTPTTNHFAMPLGDQMTFSIKVFPAIATYSWTLDDAPLTNPGNSYVYTAQAGDHVLTIKAKHFLGTDIQTWNIQTVDPITSLLNSLVSIPAGTFMMGSTDNEYGWAEYTTPVHQVTLQAFDIGAYEVTQAQYKAVMGTNPSYFQGPSYPGTENNPVEYVTWNEAREFCTLLSAQTGRTFTLPSEAQWEYACRAGTTTLYSFGDSDALLVKFAWCWENSNGTGGPYGTHPVGTKLPNPWNLYDMHGNVWEWCLDSWHNNYSGAPTDGSAWEPETGLNRMIRGGSWYYSPGSCRSAPRYDCGSDFMLHYIGFRIVEIPAS